MTDYITSDTDLTAVADAIRSKGGTSAALEWPSGFSSAIADIPSGGSTTLITGVLRPDAELVNTWTYDKYINADEGIEIPEYTTTATSLMASENLTPTVTLDLDGYNYYVLERFLAIPEYNIDTKAKGRCEYWVGSVLYEITEFPANTIHTLVDPTKFYTSRLTGMNVSGTYRELYWSSASAIAVYATSAYGVYETVTAPSVSGTTLTVKSPAFGIRGHASYFTNTYFNALTDIRYQWRIELWRAPKGNLNLDGWGLAQNFMKAYEAIDAADHTLT